MCSPTLAKYCTLVVWEMGCGYMLDVKWLCDVLVSACCMRVCLQVVAQWPERAC